MLSIKSDRSFGLDVVRCIAIICVLFSHSCFLLPVPVQLRHALFLGFGYFGVELFFVLSGYLVGIILINLFSSGNNTFQRIKHFWLRRWLRTLPAYYLVLLVNIVFYNYVNTDFSFNSFLDYLYFIFLQNFITPQPSFFIIAWSLAVEEWFYILLPIWIRIFVKWTKSKKALLLSLIYFFVFILVLRITYVLITPLADWDKNIRMMVPFRLDSLITGIFIAYLRKFSPLYYKMYKRIGFALGLVLLVLCICFFYYDVILSSGTASFFSKTFFFNITSMAFAMLLPLASSMDCKNLIVKKVIITISHISYSLYLLHPLVFYLVITFVNRLVRVQMWEIRFIACWLTVLVCAYFFYIIYERPMTQLREKFKY